VKVVQNHIRLDFSFGTNTAISTVEQWGNSGGGRGLKMNNEPVEVERKAGLKIGNLSP